MKKGEIWVNIGLDGHWGTLIGEKIKDNEWACTHLIKIGQNTYTRHTGRVSSMVDPSAYYTGEGSVFEAEFIKYNRLTAEGEVQIVDNPVESYETTSTPAPEGGYVIFDMNTRELKKI